MLKKTKFNPQLNMFGSPYIYIGERAYKKYSSFSPIQANVLF